MQGVKTSENGLFLYKSTQADDLVRSRIVDYAALGFLGSLITGMSQIAFIPLFYIAL